MNGTRSSDFSGGLITQWDSHKKLAEVAAADFWVHNDDECIMRIGSHRVDSKDKIMMMIVWFSYKKDHFQGCIRFSVGRTGRQLPADILFVSKAPIRYKLSPRVTTCTGKQVFLKASQHLKRRLCCSPVRS